MAVAFEIDPVPICFCWLLGVGHVGVVVAWEPSTDSGNVQDNRVAAMDYAIKHRALSATSVHPFVIWRFRFSRFDGSIYQTSLPMGTSVFLTSPESMKWRGRSRFGGSMNPIDNVSNSRVELSGFRICKTWPAGTSGHSSHSRESPEITTPRPVISNTSRMFQR